LNSERNTTEDQRFGYIMKKFVAFFFLILFTGYYAFAQNTDDPRIEVVMKKTLDYQRPSRLQEEDRKKGVLFKFVPGLEIVTDIDAVKVYLFDIESGRTPYENNDINSGYTRIKLEKPGYKDYTFWVNIKDNYRTTVYIYYKNLQSSLGYKSDLLTERKSTPLYSSINPADSEYYRQIFFINSSDSKNLKKAVISQGHDKDIVALVPHPVDGGNVFVWDGCDAEGSPVPAGDYDLNIVPFHRSLLRVDRHFTRQALNYFSGFSGLSLVPSAKIFFWKGFQFGSSFGIESVRSSHFHDYNLPFSFFLRLSPLKGWEASVEAETAFITESGRPTIRLNSSQKVYLFNFHTLQFTLGIRGSYKSAINDFSEKMGGDIIRDPSGFSIFLPVQYGIQGWSFYGSPELLYTFRPLTSNILSDEFDLTGALRWGVKFSSGQFFSAGLSTALFFPSYRGNPFSLQASVEGYFYLPGTPLYINPYGIIQKVQGNGDGTILGMNLGFVL